MKAGRSSLNAVPREERPAPVQQGASWQNDSIIAQSADGVQHQFPAKPDPAVIGRVIKNYATKPPQVGNDGMIGLNVGDKTVRVHADFLKLSPADQNKTVDEIASQISAMANFWENDPIVRSQGSGAVMAGPWEDFAPKSAAVSRPWTDFAHAQPQAAVPWYAKQANINDGGQQQVNNGSASRAPANETENQPNKLLEQSLEARMDTGTQSQPFGSDSTLEAVGTVNRANVRMQKYAIAAQGEFLDSLDL